MFGVKWHYTVSEEPRIPWDVSATINLKVLLQHRNDNQSLATICRQFIIQLNAAQFLAAELKFVGVYQDENGLALNVNKTNEFIGEKPKGILMFRAVPKLNTSLEVWGNTHCID